MKLSEIRPRDIIKWQNMLIELKKADGGKYSNTYYKTVQAQLSDILNHAVRFYDLEYNPVKSVFSAVAIGERVGHKSERITYYYAHLFPGVQEMVAKKLDEMR